MTNPGAALLVPSSSLKVKKYQLGMQMGMQMGMQNSDSRGGICMGVGWVSDGIPLGVFPKIFTFRRGVLPT